MSEPDWTAQRYTSNASFVYSDSFVAPVLGLLAAQQGERVMDLGCGTGEVTAQLADSVAPGQLVGVDSSAEMLSGAKIQCASKRNVQFVQWDGQDLASCAALGDEFDAVFSNATLHWMKRSPASVVSGVHSLLKQGGRFVGEFGGHLNVGSVRSQLHAVLNARGYDAAALDPWSVLLRPLTTAHMTQVLSDPHGVHQVARRGRLRRAFVRARTPRDTSPDRPRWLARDVRVWVPRGSQGGARGGDRRGRRALRHRLQERGGLVGHVRALSLRSGQAMRDAGIQSNDFRNPARRAMPWSRVQSCPSGPPVAPAA